MYDFNKRDREKHEVLRETIIFYTQNNFRNIFYQIFYRFLKLKYFYKNVKKRLESNRSN